MAVAPSCQLHTTTFLDSLHSSFHKLRTPNLPFVRRSYFLLPPRRKLHFYVNPIHAEQNPSQKPNSFPKPNNNNNFKPLPTEDSSQKPTWIDKWSETRFRNLPKRPAAVLDYRNGGVTSEDDEVGSSRSTGSGTMEKIVEKLKKFGYIDDVGERKERVLPEKGSVEDIFYAEEGVLPNSRGGLSLDLNEEVRFPWEKKPLEGERESEGGDSSSGRMKRSRTSLAELTLPEGELRRLRHLAIRTKSKTKIGGAGVSKEIVDKIHEKWMTEELVRLKCEGPPALNMKRMHEILERKTGGLVIWRSGSSISLYRGASYELPQPEKNHVRKSYMTGVGSSSKATYRPANTIEDGSESKMQALSVSSTSSDEKKEVNRSSSEINYEQEVDRLLDGLGPRYTDWPGCDPLPVDADLLPGVAPGYRPPFRILPYGVRSTLGNKEMTALRRLARVLPPHFALGRSRQHQGLALAMMKLWERSSIAKIALKRGVQLTSSERMAEDIKKLTGSTVISRNKDYIVFYRGKDFLSPEVTEALMERERMTKALQEEEEQARIRATTSIISNIETNEEAGTAGTLGETLEADARWGKRLDDDDRNKMMRAAEVARHAELVRKLDWKLFQAERKLMKAENALAKVEEFLKPAESKPDPESITDEERFMFRKLGLRMKAFLLLGRRGVFDGTVENMHLHWKYRELVKILVKAKTFSQVRNVALSLEAESGGILVSVDKISKGFAIIVYRGKDYKRPPTLRPKNLLTKRKALARSIELQRREALYGHITRVNRRVEQLRSELDQMEFVKGQGDEELYAKLDSAYLSDDDDTEDEGDDAYLETVDDSVITDSDEAEGYDDSVEDSNVNLHSGLNSHCKDPTVVQETYAESSSSGSCEPNPEGAEVDIKDVIEFCDSR